MRGGNKTQNKESTEAAAAEGEKKTTAPKKGKGKGVSKEDQMDLEQIIADLRDELLWKNEEILDMRTEFDEMKILVSKLHIDNKKEKAQRQILEANKQKYIMMGELLDCKGQIQEKTFFDAIRN